MLTVRQLWLLQGLELNQQLNESLLARFILN